MTKTMVNKLIEIFVLKSTDSWDNKILVSVRTDLDNSKLKIVNIVVSLV